MFRLLGLVARSCDRSLHRDHAVGSYREARIVQGGARDRHAMSVMLVTLLVAVVPVLAGFLGFYLNHRWESQRQESRRAYDRQERRRETKRATLVELQRALAEVNDGWGTAARLVYLTEEWGIEAVQAALQEPWFRGLQKASQTLTMLTA